MTQPYSPRVPGDPKADPNQTIEALDIEATTVELAAESAANRLRVTALGRCACVAYLHAAISSGAPSTAAAAGVRITTVAADVSIVLDPPVTIPYTVQVSDQESGSNLVYRANDRLSRSLTVRATNLTGMAVDLSTGDRAFCLEIRQLLPETF